MVNRECKGSRPLSVTWAPWGRAFNPFLEAGTQPRLVRGPGGADLLGFRSARIYTSRQVTVLCRRTDPFLIRVEFPKFWSQTATNSPVWFNVGYGSRGYYCKPRISRKQWLSSIQKPRPWHKE
jgi:hypothetical protein